MPNQLFVIVDYNLTRVDDVRIMTRHARDRHRLTTVLIRSLPGALDREIAEHVVDLDPLAPDFVARAEVALRLLGEPKAILAFSDNAVVSGAALAEAFALRADSAALAETAYSKLAYRKAEARFLEFFPDAKVQAPRFAEVKTLAEVRAFAAATPAGFVIKPSCEGNNRGVIKVLQGDDYEAAFNEVEPYLALGVLCEEIIALPMEFSYDGLGSLTFVTQKSSVSGRYPVENGQSVPARVSPELAAAITTAGQIANVIDGQLQGPFHNEVKADPQSHRVAVIEPNRRPAGMRIWHLASRVYGINFFELWVDAMLGTATLPARLEAHGVASIRMLPAPRSGRLSTLPGTKEILAEILSSPTVERLTRELSLDWHDFAITAAACSWVSDVIVDNSKFIAQISCFSPLKAADLEPALAAFELGWRQAVNAHILAPDQEFAV